MPKEMVALIQKPEIMAAIMGAIVAGMITGIGWTVTTPQKHRNDRREAERVRAHEAQLLSEARSRDVLFACKQSATYWAHVLIQGPTTAGPGCLEQDPVGVDASAMRAESGTRTRSGGAGLVLTETIIANR
jgi:hypothetical protein